MIDVILAAGLIFAAGTVILQIPRVRGWVSPVFRKARLTGEAVALLGTISVGLLGAIWWSRRRREVEVEVEPESIPDTLRDVGQRLEPVAQVFEAQAEKAEIRAEEVRKAPPASEMTDEEVAKIFTERGL